VMSQAEREWEREGEIYRGGNISGAAEKYGTLTARSHAFERYRSGKTWPEMRLTYSGWTSGSTLDLMCPYLISSVKTPRRKLYRALNKRITTTNNLRNNRVCKVGSPGKSGR
jgi:hypothetical protein